jgi:PAS domain S-box-containing protein
MPRIVALILLIVSMLSLTEHIYFYMAGHDSALKMAPLFKAFLSESNHMTVFSSFNFLLFGFVLYMLPSRKKNLHNLAHFITLPIAYIGLFFVASYLLKIYVVTDLTIIPLAVVTGISFLCLCCISFFIRPDTWLMEVYTSNLIGGMIAKWVTLPLLILAFLMGWLWINGERIGLFESAEGVILVSMSYTFFSVILIWIAARFGNKLDKLRRKSDIELGKSNARLQLLSDIAGRLLLSDDPQTIVNELCVRVSEFLDCQVYFNYLVDANKNQLHLNAFGGITDETSREIEWIDFGVAVCGSVARDSKRIIAENIQRSDEPITSLIRSFGVQAYACHPLMSDNKVIGTLSFGTKSRSKFKADEISLMKVVADQVAIAINRIRNQKALQESEDRFSTIARLSPVLISITLMSDSTMKYANEAYLKKFGFTENELLGKPAKDMYYNAEDRRQLIEILKKKGKVDDFEVEVKGADGKPFWVFSSIRQITFDGAPCYLSALMDITQHRRDHDELLQLNRTLNARSKSSKAMMHAHNELQYLNEVCRIITEDCGHLMVWIGYARDDERKTVEPMAYYGFDKGYIEQMNITWDDNERGRGPTGTSIRTGKPYVCRDMITDPDFLPWREAAIQRGFKSSLVLPLIIEGKTLGSISIYSKRKDSFSGEEVRLLNDLANDLAYGISNIRLAEFERKASETIRKSEEKYRLLFEEMTEGFALHEILLDDTGNPFDYRFLTINPAFEKLTGLKARDVVGRTMREVLPGNESVWLERYGRVALTGENVQFENYSSELKRYYRVNAFCPEKGFFAVIFENITSRVLAEKELSHTKNYLENLINYSNAPIIVWDVETKIRLFNHAFEHLTGYSSAEVEGKLLEMLFPESSLETNQEKIQNALTSNLETIEIPILTKRGEVRIILWNSANIYDNESKAIISTIAQGNDITERIKAEQEVREAKHKLDLTLENASIGTWAWDITSDSFDMDERVGKMVGLNGIEKYTYENFERCIFEEDITHFRRAIRNSLQENIPFDTIFRVRKAGGHFIYLNAKARIEKNNLGESDKMAGVCIDITDMKKRTDQTLFKLNEDLLRSNKELEQFAYVASHDLQEPLRMISSFTQLLAKRYKDQLDEEAHEFINFAVDGALRMQTLINDLLEYSRVNTRGKNPVPVNMQEVMAQTIHNLGIKIKEKKALITHDNLPVIKADGNQMTQLMQNLIDNAIKFSDTQPVIHVSGKEEQGQYVFKIEDNGIGIEPQYFDRIFQIFQRLHLRDSYGGTGIGLAICKRIVERHGGKIWVETRNGEGTTFTFTIKKT